MRAQGEREEALRYMHRVYVHQEEKAPEAGESLTKELMQQHVHLQRKNKFLAHKAEHAEFWKVRAVQSCRHTCSQTSDDV